ncbi:MAG: hypothetical protein QOI11_2230 [Candidatus Eremiobacteraeota bacterium]|nr:hypothetical protein [Candidatus Eremiobacteraeota bacterium]
MLSCLCEVPHENGERGFCVFVYLWQAIAKERKALPRQFRAARRPDAGVEQHLADFRIARNTLLLQSILNVL